MQHLRRRAARRQAPMRTGLAFAVALPQRARVHAIRVREVQEGKVIYRLHLAQSGCFGCALYAIEDFAQNRSASKFWVAN